MCASFSTEACAGWDSECGSMRSSSRLTSGAHLWAERYDGEMGAVLNMQDKITQSIISALAVKVAAESARNNAAHP